MLPLRDNIPTTRTAYVTYGLIVVNVLVYFFWQRGGLSLGDPTNAPLQLSIGGVGGGPEGDHARRVGRPASAAAERTTRIRI